MLMNAAAINTLFRIDLFLESNYRGYENFPIQRFPSKETNISAG